MFGIGNAKKANKAIATMAVANKKMKVRCLTLNCFALPTIYPLLHSPHRRERVAAIARFLNENKADYDVVFLQEVFRSADQKFIQDFTKRFYPFSFVFFGR